MTIAEQTSETTWASVLDASEGLDPRDLDYLAERLQARAHTARLAGPDGRDAFFVVEPLLDQVCAAAARLQAVCENSEISASTDSIQYMAGIVHGYRLGLLGNEIQNLIDCIAVDQ